MKREERNNERNNNDPDDRNDQWKRSKEINKSASKKITDTMENQMKAYALRHQTFESNIKDCLNNYDPMFPERKLKMNDVLFFMYDKNQRRWCFNLITLWPKFEATNSYDIEGIYRHYGDVLLTLLDTKEAEFLITIKRFVRIKKTYYKYAHNIDWQPQFLNDDYN